MFSAEDYRKALSIGREYAILLNVKDSIEVKFKKVDKALNMYIALVDNLQESNNKLDLEVVELNKSFAEFTYDSQKKLQKLTNENEDLKKKNGRLLKSTFIVSAIALIQAVIIVIQIK
jgi:peptidoglycan hydrolase CwlO-like protein